MSGQAEGYEMQHGSIRLVLTFGSWFHTDYHSTYFEKNLHNLHI